MGWAGVHDRHASEILWGQLQTASVKYRNKETPDLFVGGGPGLQFVKHNICEVR